VPVPIAKKQKPLHGLGELQSEVLELVWQRGEATVADVVKQLARSRPTTYTTVLVAMQKLEKKGWLTHRSEGRAYVYQPARSKAKAQAGALREILDAVFGGDPKLLVTQLLDSRPWTADELSDLRRLIERARKGEKT
jgi:BlaI family transcriptional regulator, penicillinase repressor